MKKGSTGDRLWGLPGSELLQIFEDANYHSKNWNNKAIELNAEDTAGRKMMEAFEFDKLRWWWQRCLGSSGVWASRDTQRQKVPFKQWSYWTKHCENSMKWNNLKGTRLRSKSNSINLIWPALIGSNGFNGSFFLCNGQHQKFFNPSGCKSGHKLSDVMDASVGDCNVSSLNPRERFIEIKVCRVVSLLAA